ncbi:Acyl--binding domain-containing protein 6-like, partial [Globisporangium splendens]
MSSAKISLLDVAKSMEQQQQAPAKSTGDGEPKLSLADFAKSQAAGQPSAALGAQTMKPLSLLDVARQENAVEKAQMRVSLTNLAQEINAEESKRIESAVMETAKEVQVEQRKQHATLMNEAVAEVQQEEALTAGKFAAKVQKEQSVAQIATNMPKEQPAAKPNVNEATTAADDDGYSSFGDDEERPSKTKNEVSKKQELHDEHVSDSDTQGEGPMKTTPSDSAESKTFLRAVYRADLRKIEDMLDSGEVDATVADQHGWSGLHWAASQGHIKVLEFLLKKGAEVNAVDQMNGWAALHVAVVREQLPCAQTLLRAGADPRVRDSYGDSALDIVRAVRGKKRSKFLQIVQHVPHGG